MLMLLEKLDKTSVDMVCRINSRMCYTVVVKFILVGVDYLFTLLLGDLLKSLALGNERRNIIPSVYAVDFLTEHVGVADIYKEHVMNDNELS